MNVELINFEFRRKEEKEGAGEVYVDLAAILFVFCLTGGGAARDD